MNAVLLSIFDVIIITAMEGYENDLVELVKETTKNIQTYAKGEATLYIATIAQRASISLKVASTITWVSLGLFRMSF